MVFGFKPLASYIVCVLIATAVSRGEQPESSFIEAEFDVADDGDLLLLPVTLDGTTFQFCMDTGSSITICDSSLRHLLGKKRATSHALAVGAHAKPIELDEYATPTHATVGSLPLSGVTRVAVTDLQSFRDASGCNARGFLGMDFLGKRIVQIDIASGKARFLLKCGKECGTQINLKAGRYGERVPSVIIMLDKMGGAEFAVDTGCAGLASGIIDPHLFASLKAAGYVDKVHVLSSQSVSGARAVERGNVKGIEIGGIAHGDISLAAVGNNALGLGFWSRYVVTLDFPNGKLCIRQSSLFGKQEPIDASGLRIIRRDGKTVVQEVTSDGAGARCGIRANDVLLWVGNVDATTSRLHSLRLSLCERGRSVTVVAERDGRRLKYQLDLASP